MYCTESPSFPSYIHTGPLRSSLHHSILTIFTLPSCILHSLPPLSPSPSSHFKTTKTFLPHFVSSHLVSFPFSLPTLSLFFVFHSFHSIPHRSLSLNLNLSFSFLSPKHHHIMSIRYRISALHLALSPPSSPHFAHTFQLLLLLLLLH